MYYPLLARSNPQSARYHPLLARSNPQSARSHPLPVRSHPLLARYYCFNMLRCLGYLWIWQKTIPTLLVIYFCAFSFLS